MNHLLDYDIFFVLWLAALLLFTLFVNCFLFQKQNRFVSKEIDNMASASAPNQSINDGDRHKEYISTNQNQLAFAQFNELRQEKYLIDAKLVVGCSRRQIDAHRIVLAAVSGYFRSMFRSAMDESQQSLCCTNFGRILLNNYRSNRNVEHR